MFLFDLISSILSYSIAKAQPAVPDTISGDIWDLEDPPYTSGPMYIVKRNADGSMSLAIAPPSPSSPQQTIEEQSDDNVGIQYEDLLHPRPFLRSSRSPSTAMPENSTSPASSTPVFDKMPLDAVRHKTQKIRDSNAKLSYYTGFGDDMIAYPPDLSKRFCLEDYDVFVYRDGRGNLRAWRFICSNEPQWSELKASQVYLVPQLQMENDSGQRIFVFTKHGGTPSFVTSSTYARSYKNMQALFNVGRVRGTPIGDFIEKSFRRVR